MFPYSAISHVLLITVLLWFWFQTRAGGFGWLAVAIGCSLVRDLVLFVIPDPALVVAYGFSGVLGASLLSGRIGAGPAPAGSGNTLSAVFGNLLMLLGMSSLLALVVSGQWYHFRAFAVPSSIALLLGVVCYTRGVRRRINPAPNPAAAASPAPQDDTSIRSS